MTNGDGPYPFDPGWQLVLAARAGNHITLRRPMAVIKLDRRAEGAGGREVKFELAMRPLDQYHTHGEMERCDKDAVMAALSAAADTIEGILRRVPPKP